MRGRVSVAGALACLFIGGTAGAASAQAPPATPFAFDGDVFTSLTAGGSTWVAGNFDGQLPTSGGLVGAAATGSGALTSSGIPPVVGRVTASADDGAGGLFLGGTFTSVGGVARRNLAHVEADGTVDPTFDPSPDGAVTALDRWDGDLVLTGDFTSVGGKDVAAGHLAVLDTDTGDATAFTEDPALDGFVTAFDATDGTVYATGPSLTVGDDYPAAVALDLATGDLEPWRPEPGTLFGNGDAIKAVGSTVVVGAGDGQGGEHTLAGFDAATGAAKWTDQTPALNPLLAKAGTRLYVIPNGLFSTSTGADRTGPVTPYALDAATGAKVWTAEATLLNPFFGTQATDALALGGTLYVTGTFRTAGGEERHGAAAFDTTTGALLPWSPRLGAPGGATLGSLGGAIALGGSFTGAGPATGTVANIARLRADGSLDPSFPGVALTPEEVYLRTGAYVAGVELLALDGSTLYFAGQFTTAGGKPRQDLAAVDTRTGVVTDWAPEIPSPNFQFPSALRVFGDRIQVSGGNDDSAEFTKAGAQIAEPKTIRGHLRALQSSLKVTSPTTRVGTYVTFGPGKVSVTLTDADGTVVGSGSATGTKRGQNLKVTVTLNASAVPGVRYTNTARFAFPDGGPDVVSTVAPPS